MQRTNEIEQEIIDPADAAGRHDERGANLIEYALLLALIAIVCVGAVRSLGSTTSEPYSELESGIIG